MNKNLYIFIISIFFILIISLVYIEWLKKIELESRTFYANSNMGRLNVEINTVFVGKIRKINETVVEIIPEQSKRPDTKDASLSFLLPKQVSRLRLAFKIDTKRNFTGYLVDWLPRIKIGVFNKGENRSNAYVIYVNRNSSWYNVNIDLVNKNISVTPNPPRIETTFFQLTYTPGGVEFHIRCYELPLDSKVYVRIIYIHTI
ncbi:MAG: hypothetical protein DRJ45_02250 [Thermoprotei archaeon]|nr:MAG: hypothetical protein DRJ45_02250 [Thermoprotei archaeon]